LSERGERGIVLLREMVGNNGDGMADEWMWVY